MKRLAIPAAAAALLCVSTAMTAPVAQAQDSGLASMHTLRKEGGKLCMADHFHAGSGEGATKAKARMAAIRSWADFTDFEYGRAWARFGRAASVTTRYTKAETGWSATVEARPCR